MYTVTTTIDVTRREPGSEPVHGHAVAVGEIGGETHRFVVRENYFDRPVKAQVYAWRQRNLGHDSVAHPYTPDGVSVA